MNKKAIGARLRAARENTFMKQEDVARLIGSTFQKISSLETGRTRVDIETLVRLCGIYNVDIHDILDAPRSENQKLRLRDEEIGLIRRFRQLPNSDKQDVRQYLETRFSKVVSYIEGTDGCSTNPSIAEDVRDLHGKTYVIASCINPLEWRDPDSEDEEVRLRTRVFSEIERDYHCRIDIRPLNMRTYIQDIVEAKAAGRRFADIYYLGGENHILAWKGFLAPLQNIQTVGIGKNQWNPVNSLITSYKGDIFGVSADFVPGTCLFFNKSLARKYVPFDLYEAVKAGEWTFDTFYRICQQVYYNSGKAVCPLTAEFPMGIADAIYHNGTSPVAVRGGRYLFNGADFRLLAALDFCQKIIRSGLYDIENIGAGVSRSRDSFLSGNALFYHTGVISGPFLAASTNSGCGILPFPKGPDAAKTLSIIGNSRYFSLDADIPEPENAGALLTAVARRTAVPFETFLQRQARFFRDIGSLDVLRRLAESRQVLLINAYCSELADQIFDNAVKNNILSLRSSPSATMQAIAERAQACINRHFDQ